MIRRIKGINISELSWKIPKKLYYMRTYNNNLFYINSSIIKEMAIEQKVYTRLHKKYKPFIDNYKINNEKQVVNRTVWICWMQGLDNAPQLVKSCVQSVKDNLEDFNIVILTEENIDSYISFPNHIVEKYKKGIITRTHFSDILRVALLAQYGGLWLDSTVLCTDGDFANYIIDLPFFVYKNMSLDRTDELPIACSSWLISSKSNNPILCLTRDLLYEYWKTHIYLENFFLLHLFLSMSSRHYKNEWEKIPMYNNRSPHTLMFELGEAYDSERWKQICCLSSFHKLTRHNEYSNSNSFYQYVLKKYCSIK